MWVCITCGKTLRMEIAFPHHCSCGLIDHGNGERTIPKNKPKKKIPPTKKQVIPPNILAACETCMDWMGWNKCKSIGAGCGHDYIEATKKGKCPRGKWIAIGAE